MKASIDRFVQVGIRRGDLAAVQAVTVVDPATVRISLKEAQGSFLGALANPVALLGIMPKDLVQGAKDPLQPPQLVGTGPFAAGGLGAGPADHAQALRRLHPGPSPAGVRARRGPVGPRGRGPHHLHRRERDPVRGARARRLRLREALAPTAYERLRASTALDAIVLKPFTQVILQLNANRAPFNQVKARQAVSRGLDMETVMRGVTGNQAAFYRLQPSLFFPEQRVWHSTMGQEVYNQKNVDLARRLLKESGYDGKPIALVTNRDIEWLYRAAVPVQPQLEAIGFKVELVVRDWPGQIAQQKEGNFDMATNGISTRPEPPGSTTSSAAGRPTRRTATATPRWTRRWRRACGSASRRSGPQAYAQAQKQFYETVPLVKIGRHVPAGRRQQDVKGYKVFFLRRFWNVSK